MSGQEIFVIIVVVLLLFGADKLPEQARGFAKGIRDFRRQLTTLKRNLRRAQAS